MTDKSAVIDFVLNGEKRSISVPEHTTLLDYLRDQSLYSVKNGCREGDCGMCTILLDGSPVRSCLLSVSDVADKEVLTLEGLNENGKIHPIQKAFVDSGAIQCGFCTPAQILTVKALLDRNPDPDEDEIRTALSGVMCRCTGHVKIIDAVKIAAALIRGENVESINIIEKELPDTSKKIELPEAYYRKNGETQTLPPLVYTPKAMQLLKTVGKPELKVDGNKLAKGKPAFTDDVYMKDMLYGELLTSPHAHARIKNIDTSKALALDGVHAVMTYKDVPRVKYATGGQSYPQPIPHDQVSLDDKVRHVGDRVAIVAAETRKIAQKALKLINVEYEVLPAVLDAEEAMQEGAPVIHDEEDTEGIFDAKHNIIYHIEAEVGDLEKAFNNADHVFTGEYRTPKQHHAQMEPHVCITYWDEDERLVVRSSTQVPFHARRIIAPLIGLPVKQIRVIKPRIGGGFGGKQEVLLEDLCSHLTIETGRPVRMEFSRRQEFISTRSRHPHVIRYKVGIKDKKVDAIELKLIGDTGAYATHGLTVQMVGGFKGLSLYNAPNSRFDCDVVYTNTPVSGAYRGYGTMQETFAIEVLLEEIAEQLGVDVVEFKRANWLKVGEPMLLSSQLGEGREGFEQTMETSGLDDCVNIGLQAMDYYKKREAFKNQKDVVRKGIGMGVVMHGSGIAGLDMAAATLKMNDDASFNLLVGATDIGTGSDTILAQMAAEVLGIPVEDFIVYSSDTDFTPFDKGAYASSTTYISGGAVKKAAEKIADQIREHAAMMLDIKDSNSLILGDRRVTAPDGSSVTFTDVALNSLHNKDQHQIMATASHMSYKSPPPTAAQFAEVEVDTETGEVRVTRLLMVVDCGRVINPITAAGQVEGGMAQGLGFVHNEETVYDKKGMMANARLAAYHPYKPNEMPPMDVIFVQTDDPSGPFGAKSIAEISIDGVAPAVVNAVHNAAGIWLRDLPVTPEKVWRMLHRS